MGKVIHSLCGCRLYNVWTGIKQRCFNKNTYAYKNYGARGIKICDEWKNDFKSFYEWAMKNGYKEDLTIDRINVNGNYEPNNCRWVNKHVQAANRRPTNTTGYVGVYKDKCGFRADIVFNGKHIFNYHSLSKNDCARKRNEYILKNGMNFPLNEILDEKEVVDKHKVRTIKKENIEKLKQIHSTPVIQYDLEGNRIAEYTSQSEAARQNNVDQSSIHYALQGANRTCKGYMWRYANDPT